MAFRSEVLQLVRNEINDHMRLGGECEIIEFYSLVQIERFMC